MSVKLTLLGTAASTGIPNIGCQCRVCTDTADPRNIRLRQSAFVNFNRFNLLIDTSPDLRQQALIYRIPRLDAVLFTHHHADHLLGLDDIRQFNFIQREHIPCYGPPDTMNEIRRMFKYIFEPLQQGGGLPLIDLHTITEPFEISGQVIIPIPMKHGNMNVYGYRFENIAYCTDVNFIASESVSLLEKLDVLILGALRYGHHSTHWSIAQALEFVSLIKPKWTILTHFSHDILHQELAERLPENVVPGYDGMVIKVD
jgi:phosphoribosyl 1,2-cyclic phosphate phosphodiesterase